MSNTYTPASKPKTYTTLGEKARKRSKIERGLQRWRREAETEAADRAMCALPLEPPTVEQARARLHYRAQAAEDREGRVIL